MSLLCFARYRLASMSRASIQLPRLAAALLLGAATSLAAQTLPSTLQSCVKIVDDAARLACFDRGMAAVSADKSSDKDSSVVRVAPQQKPSPQEKFGLTGEQVQPLEPGPMMAPPRAKELQAQIAKVSQRRDGYDVFELDNGQVWLQTETRSDFLVRPGDKVTVATGALGSYWMSTDSHHAIRVKRVR